MCLNWVVEVDEVEIARLVDAQKGGSRENLTSGFGTHIPPIQQVYLSLGELVNVIHYSESSLDEVHALSLS